jgi:hypothetical protein
MDEERASMPEEDFEGEAEEIAADRNLPVLASEARPLEPARDATLAAPLVAATGGFLAGIVAFVLVRALRARPGRGLIFRRRRRGPAERALEIAASRSFLVDVHVVKR